MSSPTTTERQNPFAPLLAHWMLAIPLAILAVPTLITVGKQVWSTEIGAHGPIVLATGLWLAWRQADQLKKDATPGAPWLTALGLIASLGLYVVGRAYEFMVLEVGGLYGVCLSFLHAYVGVRAMLKNWFPILYLGFVVPLPAWLIDSVTAPLKEFVSYAATTLLQACGLPIVREGVTLMVAQYQLLVEDACSGMNSLIGLIAISLFYIYLARSASWRYSIFLVSLVVPVAILANIIRIITLVLLTYFFGDGVAQGFLHVTAGLFLFAIALLLVFAIDSVVSGFIARRRAKA